MRLVRLFSTFTFIVVGLMGFTVQAQNADECLVDLTAVDTAVAALHNADDSGSTLAAVRDARTALDEIERACSSMVDSSTETWAAEGVGQSRSNPVPRGQRQYVSDGSLSILISSVAPLSESRELALSSGTVDAGVNRGWILITIDAHCEKSPDETCRIHLNELNLVGRSSIAYQDAAFVAAPDLLQGGGETTFTVAIAARRNDSGFVLKVHDLTNFNSRPIYFMLG